jgi:uncharacterized protein (DUF952 family)
MPLIYHLVPRPAWEQALAEGGDYRAASLASEGFIHCSDAAQVARSANRYYADEPDLLLLHVDPARLRSDLCYEAAGTGELFPHIYGPINRDAVRAVEALRRGADGRWLFAPAGD